MIRTAISGIGQLVAEQLRLRRQPTVEQHADQTLSIVADPDVDLDLPVPYIVVNHPCVDPGCAGGGS